MQITSLNVVVVFVSYKEYEKRIDKRDLYAKYAGFMHKGPHETPRHHPSTTKNCCAWNRQSSMPAWSSYAYRSLAFVQQQEWWTLWVMLPSATTDLEGAPCPHPRSRNESSCSFLLPLCWFSAYRTRWCVHGWVVHGSWDSRCQPTRGWHRRRPYYAYKWSTYWLQIM